MGEQNKRENVAKYYRGSDMPCNTTLSDQQDSLREYLDNATQNGECAILNCGDVNEIDSESQMRNLQQYIEKEECEVVEVVNLGDGQKEGMSSITVIQERSH